MTKQNFKIIKGGINSGHYSYSSRRFVSAFVTDTRLMGVLALGISWEVSIPGGTEDFHQFFYFDAEEYGLDTYESLKGDNPSLLETIEQGLIGGLGGKKNPINQKEAVYLLQSFVEASKHLHVPLPPPVEEYEDLLKDPAILSDEEHKELISKICTPILSDFQLVHYFVMRSFALDSLGASYLMKGSFDPLAITESKSATLCKNTIEEHINENMTLSYLCEAVLDSGGTYELVVLEVSVSDNKITGAERRTSFRISAAEAAMMLNRPEFISVYEILSDPVLFDEHFLPMMKSAMQTNHDNGRLFMEFHNNNDHVNKRIYCLNEDVYGLYYVSDFGQLIIAAYGLKEVHEMEKTLQKSSLGMILVPTAKYEFKEPIIYDFIQSQFEDFEEFILSIQ